MFFQFILVALSSAAVVVTASLGWPRITASPRPEPLTKVHDFVVETPVGRKLANTLGVTDEANIEPVNISSVAGSVSFEIQKRAQSAVLSTVVQQLLKQYGQLSQEQQQDIQTLICQPVVQ